MRPDCRGLCRALAGGTGAPAEPCGPLHFLRREGGAPRQMLDAVSARPLALCTRGKGPVRRRQPLAGNVRVVVRWLTRTHPSVESAPCEHRFRVFVRLTSSCGGPAETASRETTGAHCQWPPETDPPWPSEIDPPPARPQPDVLLRRMDERGRRIPMAVPELL